MFCLFSKGIISQIQKDVNNTDFVTLELLSERQTQLQVYGTVESQKNNALNQMISFKNFLNVTLTKNILISALGTNWLISIVSNQANVYSLNGQPTTNPGPGFTQRICTLIHFTIPATLNSSINPFSFTSRRRILITYGTTVNGFFSGCTPFEALLESTLDCLYQIECLQLILNGFPNLNQVRTVKLCID